MKLHGAVECDMGQKVDVMTVTDMGIGGLCQGSDRQRDRKRQEEKEGRTVVFARWFWYACMLSADIFISWNMPSSFAVNCVPHSIFNFASMPRSASSETDRPRSRRLARCPL